MNDTTTSLKPPKEVHELTLLAEEKERVRRELVVTAKKLAATAREKERVRQRLVTTSTEKENVRRKLVTTAKKLAETAEERENTRRKLALTARELATTAKQREKVRLRLAVTAHELRRSRATLEQKVHDRTKDLSQARAKDEAVLTSIGDGLVVTDAGGMIERVNTMFERILGLEATDVVGKLMTDVIKVTDGKGREVPASDRLITKTLSKQTPFPVMTSTDRYYTRKDGTKIPVYVTVSPIYLKNKLIGAVQVFRDITIEKSVEKAKTEFVALASHQLRTPLTAISWYTEMMIEGDAGTIIPKQKKYLEEIYTGNKRMIELVNSLLDATRIETGTLPSVPEPINIIEVARGVLVEQHPAIDLKNLHVDEHFGTDIPPLYADPKLMRMVVQNLVANSVAYTPPGGKIDVSISLHENTSIMIKVTDNGYGIPKYQQNQIFKKLFRADNVREKEINGTGLGLYIAKSVVDDAGGRIWFESEENKGSTFFVTLPVMSGKTK